MSDLDIEKGFEMRMMDELLKTPEGAAFLRKLSGNRNAISDLTAKVLSVIGDSNLNTLEVVGFLQYAKFQVLRFSSIRKKKADK